MEDIIRQRFCYTQITPYRNYTPYKSGDHSPSTFIGDIDEISNSDNEFAKLFLMGEEDSLKYKKIYTEDICEFTNQNKGKMFTLSETPTRNKRRVKYFYSDEPVGVRCQIYYAPIPSRSKFVGPDPKLITYFTTKDRHIKRYFGDPFASISIRIIERSIRRNGDKITLKIYKHIKTRDFNCKYFRKNSSAQSITFNMVNGNFTTVRYSKIKNGRSSSVIRRNTFSQLEHLFTKGDGLFKLPETNSNPLINSQFKSVLNDDTYLNAIIETFGFKSGDVENSSKLINAFIQRFVEMKKIKVPNDYKRILTSYYPTEKFFKKNDRKLISSMLDMLKIKSNLTIKIMHEYPSINIMSLVNLCLLFGDNYPKYIGNIKSEFFEKSKVDYGYQSKNSIDNTVVEKLIISEDEKENILSLINTSDIGLNDNLITELRDHIRMLNTLRKIMPIHFRSRKYTDFHNEHMELSKMISLIRKIWINEFVFNEKMTTDVESPIYIDAIDSEFNDVKLEFFPVILRREDDYHEEGRFMHHCVGSYATSTRSIIISLRKKDNNDRVTNEFNVNTGACIQSRYFHNADPPQEYTKAIQILNDRVKKHARLEQLENIERKQTRAKINGIEIPEGLDIVRADLPWF